MSIVFCFYFLKEKRALIHMFRRKRQRKTQKVGAGRHLSGKRCDQLVEKQTWVWSPERCVFKRTYHKYYFIYKHTGGEKIERNDKIAKKSETGAQRIQLTGREHPTYVDRRDNQRKESGVVLSLCNSLHVPASISFLSSFCLLETVSGSPGWPGSLDSPASISKVLGLQLYGFYVLCELKYEISYRDKEGEHLEWKTSEKQWGTAWISRAWISELSKTSLVTIHSLTL